MLDFINDAFLLWTNAELPVALVLAVFCNIGIFASAAYILERLTQRLVTKSALFSYIIPQKTHNLSARKRREINNGIIACVIFSVSSLFSRALFEGIWPTSLFLLLVQIIGFTVYYECYSYLVHRLLHSKKLIKIHAVHHRSVVVSPWSAYSVHFIEALMIGMSAPFYMLFFDISLAVVFAFHLFGMVFTIAIHSNLQLNSQNLIARLINQYTHYHANHHRAVNVNFGFINSLLDRIFKTRLNLLKA